MYVTHLKMWCIRRALYYDHERAVNQNLIHYDFGQLELEVNLCQSQNLSLRRKCAACQDRLVPSGIVFVLGVGQSIAWKG